MCTFWRYTVKKMSWENPYFRILTFSTPTIGVYLTPVIRVSRKPKTGVYLTLKQGFHLIPETGVWKENPTPKTGIGYILDICIR